MDKNFNYYKENAKEYCEKTFVKGNLNTLLYFCSFVPNNSKILDIGCGSGRDSLFFKKLNYEVEAIDYVPEICEIASRNTNINVRRMNILNDNLNDTYQGIWANASLVHLSKDELKIVLNKIHKALDRNGYFYCSLKIKAMNDKSRDFLEISTKEMEDLLKENKFEIIEVWESSDCFGRNNIWGNYLCKKL